MTSSLTRTVKREDKHTDSHPPRRTLRVHDRNILGAYSVIIQMKTALKFGILNSINITITMQYIYIYIFFYKL